MKRSSNEARLANVGAQKGFTREGAMNGQVPPKKKKKKKRLKGTNDPIKPWDLDVKTNQSTNEKLEGP